MVYFVYHIFFSVGVHCIEFIQMIITRYTYFLCVYYLREIVWFWSCTAYWNKWNKHRFTIIVRNGEQLIELKFLNENLKTIHSLNGYHIMIIIPSFFDENTMLIRAIFHDWELTPSIFNKFFNVLLGRVYSYKKKWHKILFSCRAYKKKLAVRRIWIGCCTQKCEKFTLTNDIFVQFTMTFSLINDTVDDIII